MTRLSGPIVQIPPSFLQPGDALLEDGAVQTVDRVAVAAAEHGFIVAVTCARHRRVYQPGVTVHAVYKHPPVP